MEICPGTYFPLFTQLCQRLKQKNALVSHATDLLWSNIQSYFFVLEVCSEKINIYSIYKLQLDSCQRKSSTMWISWETTYELNFIIKVTEECYEVEVSAAIESLRQITTNDWLWGIRIQRLCFIRAKTNPVPPEYNCAFRNGHLYRDRLVDLNLQIQKQNSFFVLLLEGQTQFHSWSPK